MIDGAPEVPISPEEYATLVYHRKAGTPTLDTEAKKRFETLCRRFHTQFPPLRERTTLHEAGHAVVSHRLGYWVAEIQLMPNPEDPFLRGNTLCARPQVGSDDWAMVTVAGYLAEGRAFGHVDPNEAWFVASRFRGDPDQRLARVAAVEARALAILDGNWAAVRRVAERVQEQGAVRAQELGGLLADVEFGGAR